MRNDKTYLRHILDTINDIEEFTDGVTAEEFLENKEKQYAVLRAFEIIGEASKNVSDGFKTKHPQIPWTKMAAMRDKLIHGYFGVNLNLVWETARTNIPEIKKQLKKLV